MKDWWAGVWNRVQRNKPIWPFITGLSALVGSLSLLAVLIYGLSEGRPRTPSPLLFWIGFSIVILVLIAFQWGRWMFIGFASVIVVLLLILLAEFGETVNQKRQIENALTTQNFLVTQLDRSEHLAASMELKGLSESLVGPIPVGTPGSQLVGLLSLRIGLLTNDLLKTSDLHPVPSTMILTINNDQVLLGRALVAARSLIDPPAVSVASSALSIRWSTYFLPATTDLESLCSRLIKVRKEQALSCPSGKAVDSAKLSPDALQQLLTGSEAAVYSSVNEVAPSASNQAVADSADNAARSAYVTPATGVADVAGDLSAGAGSLIRFIEVAGSTSSWWNSSFPPGAWIILGLVVLIGLRGLLLINNANGWGPVELVMDGKDNPTPVEQERLARIRSYVIENVPEPAAAPGSNVVKQITTLASSTSLGAPGWLRAVANFVEWAFLPPSGYRVLIDFRSDAPSPEADGSPDAPSPEADGSPDAPSPEADGSPDAPSPEADGSPDAPSPKADGNQAPGDKANATLSSVVVRIATRGRSKTLDVNSLSPSTPTVMNSAVEESNLLREAGFWTAGWILSRSKLIPAWAKWPAASGEALGRFADLSRNSRLSDKRNANERVMNESIDCLENARARGPRSGLVLTRLAEWYQFRTDFLNAVEINLQVARLFPRYYVAHYRAAVGMDLLVSSKANLWMPAVSSSDQQALRILNLFDEIGSDSQSARSALEGLRSQAASTSVLGDPDAAAAKRDVARLAGSQLQKSIKLTKLRWMCVMALRRDERRFWLARIRHPLDVRHNLASALPSIALTGNLIEKSHTLRWRVGSNSQGVPPEIRRVFAHPMRSRVERWTKSRNATAQVFYNLACFYARIPAYQIRAVELLEKSQSHPGYSQIEGSWMWRDPDLLSLHSEPRFDRIVNLILGGTRARSARQDHRIPKVPTVMSLSPSSGPISGQTRVVIRGDGFEGVAAVKFGDKEATQFTKMSSSEIVAVSPPGSPGVVTVSVDTVNDSPILGDVFTYQ